MEITTCDIVGPSMDDLGALRILDNQKRVPRTMILIYISTIRFVAQKYGIPYVEARQMVWLHEYCHALQRSKYGRRKYNSQKWAQHMEAVADRFAEFHFRRMYRRLPLNLKFWW